MATFKEFVSFFVKNLPAAALRVTTIGAQTVLSIIPGLNNLFKAPGTTSATSVDSVAVSMTDLYSYLFSPPGTETNAVINEAIVNWLKKNFIIIIGLIVAVILLIRAFKHKKRR
jgi:hypothetical protein